MKNKTYKALWAIHDGRQAGKIATDIGIIISNCYAASKKKLSIVVRGQSVCPDCQKKTWVKKP